MEFGPSPLEIVYTALSISEFRATLNRTQFRRTHQITVMCAKEPEGSCLGKTLNACLNHVPSYEVGRVENLTARMHTYGL